MFDFILPDAIRIHETPQRTQSQADLSVPLSVLRSLPSVWFFQYMHSIRAKFDYLFTFIISDFKAFDKEKTQVLSPLQSRIQVPGKQPGIDF
jgi:hypothetical protein